MRKTHRPGTPIPRAFRRAFSPLAVSETGPKLELTGDPATQTVVMRFTWDVTNQGLGVGVAGLRVNLQIDAALGDYSQLIISGDRSKDGFLAPRTVFGAATNTPMTIQPGLTGRLMVDFDIPVFDILGRQGSVGGFNWWIVELTIRDQTKDTLAVMQPDLSVARYEVRDWFKIIQVAAAQLVAASLAYRTVTVQTLGTVSRLIAMPRHSTRRQWHSRRR